MDVIFITPPYKNSTLAAMQDASNRTSFHVLLLRFYHTIHISQEKKPPAARIFIRAEGLIPRRLRRIKGIKSDCNTL